MSSTSGLVQVAGGFSQSISAGSVWDPVTGKKIKRRQFRLKLSIADSYGSPTARRALALACLADIVAMRDALVDVRRGAEAQYLMMQAGAVCDDPEKFAFAIAAANVVMTRPSERASEASTRFTTWGQLARAWCSQELARLYPNAGYGKKTAEDTDAPRVEYLCKFIADVPLASFHDDDYWRAMRPARARCKADTTFKQYSQIVRRVLKIAVELKIIAAWPLSAVCKLPKIAKGSSPEFPFLYPEEFVRLMRCELIRFEHRALWGFIIREGLRIGEAYRIRWEHLSQTASGRWLLDVPDTKTGRALNFLLNKGTGEVLAELRRRMPDQRGPFAWMTATNVKRAAEDLRRHVEQSGTTRERLLFTDGRLRRLREHDLRSTYVTWCKLAGIDNETISQHTGHESSTMIARYNRSKATLEHLELAPYLPLDEAFGERALAGAEAELLPLLGAGQAEGEADAAEASAQATLAAVQAASAALHTAAAVSVTSTLQPPRASAPRPPLPEGDDTEPREAGCLCQWEAGDSPCPVHGEDGEAGGATQRDVMLHHATERTAAQRSELGEPGAGRGVGDPLPALGAALPLADFDSGYAPGHLLRERAAALNGWTGCDAGCDAGEKGEGGPMLENEKSSVFDAGARERGRTSTPVRALEPKSGDCATGSNKRGENGSSHVPETTGSGLASHPGVTLLGQLEAAARQALAEHNWAALRALEPLIDAEVARLEAVAREAPPAPVRLEVVRARKGGAS